MLLCSLLSRFLSTVGGLLGFLRIDFRNLLCRFFCGIVGLLHLFEYFIHDFVEDDFGVL